MEPRVAARSVGVRFLFNSQGEVVTPGRARIAPRRSEAWGLREITTSFGEGEGVALIGPTGSGKTTLLRAIAGVLCPDRGELVVRGRVASMLSIDAGLIPTLTGRENALLLAVLGGASRSAARDRLDSIGARSGLGEAYERPASTYSQGMRARLGFTAATEFEREVILLDEVHEALDHDFRARLQETAQRALGRGAVLIAAGHDHEILSQVCRRAVALERGAVIADGPFEQVLAEYLGRGPQASANGETEGAPRVAEGPG
jgi:ABC-type polysaccharide/polyol phosphate transport system ATPase subunit